jgi:holo-[acyl-carrier protein] synthase
MAIVGTGIDIIEINRIGDIVEKSPRFLDRVFTPDEIEYFYSRGPLNPCHIAGTFAAKEAVLKALGTGLRGMRWKDIEISRKSSGKPGVILHGNAMVLAQKLNIYKMHISISHGKEHAIAQAVAEGE